jgi:hypothetical protein
VQLEVVTMLGSTCVERVVVRDRVGDFDVVKTANGYVLRRGDVEHRLPARLPFGLGELIVTPFVRPTWELPRPDFDARTIAFVGASLAVHLGILTVALMTPLPHRPPPQSRGGSRPRLVANHTTATRAIEAPDALESVHDVDVEAQKPIGEAAPPAMPAGEIKVERTQVDPGMDVQKQAPSEAARHFDPCADGDCGLIATARFDTTARGRQAGDSYQLPERHSLSMSVVECSVDGGCNTVSGNDQNDIRTEIGHHVAEVNECFVNHPAQSASVDATVEAEGTVRVAAHDETSTCIANVIAKLKFPGGERDVTLAFSAPS